jgi:hypothetical protein
MHRRPAPVKLPPLKVTLTTKADVPNVNGDVFPRALVERIASELRHQPKPVMHGFAKNAPKVGDTIVGTAALQPDGTISVEVHINHVLLHGRLAIGDVKIGGQYRAERGVNNIVYGPAPGTSMVAFLAVYAD